MTLKQRLKAYRILALSITVTSLCTTLSASISLPLAYLYLNKVQSYLTTEVSTCKATARDVLRDVAELKALPKGELFFMHRFSHDRHHFHLHKAFERHAIRALKTFRTSRRRNQKNLNVTTFAAHLDHPVREVHQGNLVDLGSLV